MGLDLIGLIVISALSIIALLIVIVVGFKAAKENELEPKIIELITEAEGKFTEGSVKFEYVFDKLYNVLAPNIVKVLFSAKEIRQIIQYVFDKVKIALDYQQNK